MLVIFKYHKDPKRFFDLGCTLVDIMVMMNLHSAWAIFGFTFIYSNLWEECIDSTDRVWELQQVAIFMLAKSCLVLFINILMIPRMLKAILKIAYQNFYSCLLKKRTRTMFSEENAIDKISKLEKISFRICKNSSMKNSKCEICLHHYMDGC